VWERKLLMVTNSQCFSLSNVLHRHCSYGWMPATGYKTVTFPLARLNLDDSPSFCSGGWNVHRRGDGAAVCGEKSERVMTVESSIKSARDGWHFSRFSIFTASHITDDWSAKVLPKVRSGPLWNRRRQGTFSLQSEPSDCKSRCSLAYCMSHDTRLGECEELSRSQ
jgi:hypothetical protein